MNEQQQRALAAGLRALAEASQSARPGAHVEAAVMAAMSRTPVRRIGWFTYAAAAALFVAALSGAWVAHRVERALPAPIHPSGFIEVPGASALPPLESGSIIRVSVPVASLPQYGLPVPDTATLTVEAEFLVAQDGVPRAIRLVNDLHTTRSTP